MSDAAGENWSRNIRYSANRIVAPRTLDELRRVIAASDSVKALGSRHSFTRIADTTGTLVSTAELDVPMQVDAGRRRVRVGGGVRYGELAQELEKQGWALANLASLPHISVAGAVSTGTHGSGVANRSLAAAVTGLDLVTSTGELVRFTEQDDTLAGAVVGLGALGVVASVELAIEPSYEIEQTVYDDVPLEAVRKSFDVIAGSAYSVSFFTTFRQDAYVDQVWRKQRTDAPPLPIPAALRDREASGPRHPLPGVSVAACTVQGGEAGAWLDRLPHFRLKFTPSNGEELQSEFLLPIEDAADAFDAIRALSPELAPVLQVCEIRTVAGDDLWLSPSSGRDSVAFHFTWRSDEEGVAAALPALEGALAEFGARPHWGKVFTPRDPAELYPRWADFVTLQRELDPRGAFVNEYLRGLGL